MSRHEGDHFGGNHENIPVVTAMIDEQLEALDCPMKTQMQLDIAIDELFANIANYAYPDGKGDATVRFDDSGNENGKDHLYR